MSYWRTLDNKYEVDVLIYDALTHHVEVGIEVWPVTQFLQRLWDRKWL